MKNGSSTESRKNGPVFVVHRSEPNVVPSPRDQPPWDHGPITSLLSVPGLSRSAAAYVIHGPARSSVS